MKTCLAWLAVLAVSSCAAADRWELQYFYDEAGSSLVINDLKFPSAERGVAAGYIVKSGDAKPVVLVTGDGGRNWSFVNVRHAGLSLFFLNESVGWMVTDKGIWKTVESGRSWNRMPASPKGALRVLFLDENHGWAVGDRKSVWHTSDGGRRWKPLEAAANIKTSAEFTSFSWIVFSGGRFGLVAGASTPPRTRGSRLPDWMEPERAATRREWPAINVLLETRDAGKTWTASSTSMFGRITRVELMPDGRGLGLIEFFNAFEWPSEVFELDWRTGKSTRVFREKDSAVTDIAWLPGGRAYLAAFEPSGTLARSPVPGKVRMFRSEDLKNWEEMEVDYRAVARRITLAPAGRDHIWAATDTGMILRLVSDRSR